MLNSNELHAISVLLMKQFYLLTDQYYPHIMSLPENFLKMHEIYLNNQHLAGYGRSYTPEY